MKLGDIKVGDKVVKSYLKLGQSVQSNHTVTQRLIDTWASSPWAGDLSFRHQRSQTKRPRSIYGRNLNKDQGNARYYNVFEGIHNLRLSPPTRVQSTVDSLDRCRYLGCLKLELVNNVLVSSIIS